MAIQTISARPTPKRGGPAVAESRQRPSRQQENLQRTRLEQPRLRPRNNPRLILIGLLCAALGALTLSWVWLQTSHSQDVVIAAHAIAKGQPVSAADLTTVSIGAASGAAVIPASELGNLAGKTALMDLPSGAVVAPAALGVPVVPPGTAQVGLKLGAGRLPSSPLPAGTQVRLVPLTQAQAGVQFDATVVAAPSLLPDGQTWLVDVAVVDASANQVAILAAADQLVVIRKADR